MLVKFLVDSDVALGDNGCGRILVDFLANVDGGAYFKRGCGPLLNFLSYRN